MIVALLTACVVVSLPEVGADFLSIIQEDRAEELTAGRALVLDRCGSCHAIPSPARSADPAWPDTLAIMADKAELSAVEAAQVDHYLRAAHAFTLATESAAKGR